MTLSLLLAPRSLSDAELTALSAEHAWPHTDPLVVAIEYELSERLGAEMLAMDGVEVANG